MKRPNRTEINHSNILDKTGVMEIRLKPFSTIDIGSFGIGAMSAQHQFEEKRPTCNNLRKTQLNLGARTSANSAKYKKERKKFLEDQPQHAHLNPIRKPIISTSRNLKENVQNSEIQAIEEVPQSHGTAYSQSAHSKVQHSEQDPTPVHPQHPEMAK